MNIGSFSYPLNNNLQSVSSTQKSDQVQQNQQLTGVERTTPEGERVTFSSRAIELSQTVNPAARTGSENNTSLQPENALNESPSSVAVEAIEQSGQIEQAQASNELADINVINSPADDSLQNLREQPDTPEVQRETALTEESANDLSDDLNTDGNVSAGERINTRQTTLSNQINSIFEGPQQGQNLNLVA